MGGTSIVVFGAGGQVGSELVSHHEAAKRFSFYFVRRADAYIDDPVAVHRALQTVRASLVINAAAYTSVDNAEIELEAAFLGNAEGPKLLAIACAERDLPFIPISTNYVFDGEKSTPYVESDETAPINVYGKSKRAGEIAVQQLAPSYVILRTSWLFGPFGRNFLKTILRLAESQNVLRVVDDQRGCPTATIDLVDAILAIAPRLIAREPIVGIYHFAGPYAATWYDFAQEIVSAAAPYLGRRPEVVPIKSQEYSSWAAPSTLRRSSPSWGGS